MSASVRRSFPRTVLQILTALLMASGGLAPVGAEPTPAGPDGLAPPPTLPEPVQVLDSLGQADLATVAMPPVDLEETGHDGPFAVTGRIGNGGDAASAPTAARLLDAATGETLGEAPVPVLAPGQQHDVSIEWTAPAGLTKLLLVADATGLVAESDEGNNQAGTWVYQGDTGMARMAAPSGPSGPEGHLGHGMGSPKSVLLDRRPMDITVVAAPDPAPSASRSIETPNGTVEVTAPPTSRLSIAFEDADHSGQDVWLNAGWLRSHGIGLPVVRHEDGGEVAVEPVGGYWLAHPAHFSVLHVFDANAEVFEKVSEQPESDVVYSSGRLYLESDRTDAADESLVRDFVPHAQYTVSAKVDLDYQGNAQGAYPLAVGTRGERASPAAADLYAPKSFGFYYDSRDCNTRQAPQIVAYYRGITGASTPVWTHQGPTLPTTFSCSTIQLDWQFTLRLRVTASTTYFEFLDSAGTVQKSQGVPNSALPLAYANVLFLGSEDRCNCGFEPVTKMWIDDVEVKDVVGNHANEAFSSLSGWTTTGTATCCSESVLRLTPDDYHKVGTLTKTGLTATRFSAEFRMKSGPRLGDGADGITFVFYKDMSYTPADGGAMGFIDTWGGSTSGHRGYGVQFNTWQNAEHGDPSGEFVALVEDDVGTAGRIHYANTPFEGTSWHTVNVEVFESRMMVYVDGALKLYANHDFSDRFYTGFGFTGATGDFRNDQLVDDFRLSVPPQAPNTAPPDPQYASPSAGQSAVPNNPTLQWNAVTDPDGDGVSYDVYFGTSPNPPKVATRTTTSYTTSTSPTTTYFWRIVAKDDRGGSSAGATTWTFTTTYLPSNGLVQDFESGLGLWTASGMWHLTGRRAYGGAQSAWYGQEATGNYDNGATNSGALTSPSFVVPSASPMLTFKSYHHTETLANVDTKKIDVSTNGGASWTPFASLTDAPQEWTWRSFSMAAYAGQTVRIRFAFDTADPVLNAYEGWYVDTVRVGTESSPVACYEPDPAVGGVNTQFTLDAFCSSDSESAADGLRVRWDFDNDGDWDIPFSLGKEQAAWFSSIGAYTVRMEVQDEALLTATTQRTITVQNQVPTLEHTGEAGYTADGVQPDSGTTATNFVFRVKYRDPDGTAPSHVRIVLDGTARAMSLVSGTPANGATYSYNTLLDLGTHPYHFEASDGLASARLPAAGDASVTATMASGLYSGQVSPASGTSAVPYQFKVRYVSLSGAPPSSVKLVIDGTPLEMSPLDPLDTEYDDGAYYVLNIKLKAAPHSHYFVAQEGASTYRFPTAGSVAGPAVARANLAPIAAFKVGVMEGSTMRRLPDTASVILVDAVQTSDWSDGDAVTYAWDWGDGSTSSGRTAQHSYAAAGDYVIRLTASDADGQRADGSSVLLRGVRIQPNELRNGVSEQGTLSGVGKSQAWRFYAPVGMANLRFQLQGPAAADYDLYVRHGSEPTTTSYDSKGTGVRSIESVVMANPAGGWYYLMVRSVAGSGSYTVSANAALAQQTVATQMLEDFEGGNVAGWTLAGAGGGVAAASSDAAAHQGFWGLHLDAATDGASASASKAVAALPGTFSAQAWLLVPDQDVSFSEFTVLQLGAGASPEVRIAFQDDDLSLDVWSNGAWTMDVAAVDPSLYASVRVQAGPTKWDLHVLDRLVGSYTRSGAVVNTVSMGDASPSAGRGELFLDSLVVRTGDTDTDGLSDSDEIAGRDITVDGQSVRVDSDPYYWDTDNDFRSDLAELTGTPQTLPRKGDTDDDGFFDGIETDARVQFDPQEANTLKIAQVETTNGDRVAWAVYGELSVSADVTDIVLLPVLSVDAYGLTARGGWDFTNENAFVEAQAFVAVIPGVEVSPQIAFVNGHVGVSMNLQKSSTVGWELHAGCLTFSTGVNPLDGVESIDFHPLDWYITPALHGVLRGSVTSDGNGLTAMMADGSEQPVTPVLGPDGTYRFFVGSFTMDATGIHGVELDHAPEGFTPPPLDLHVDPL